MMGKHRPGLGCINFISNGSCHRRSFTPSGVAVTRSGPPNGSSGAGVREPRLRGRPREEVRHLAALIGILRAATSRRSDHSFLTLQRNQLTSCHLLSASDSAPWGNSQDSLGALIDLRCGCTRRCAHSPRPPSLRWRRRLCGQICETAAPRRSDAGDPGCAARALSNEPPADYPSTARELEPSRVS